MKNIQILFLLLTLFIGCSEEVAKELSESTSSSARSSNKSLTSNIKLISKTENTTSHFLHKSGTDADCELSFPASYTSQDYSNEYDESGNTSNETTADCILEVDEIDLYAQGAELEFTASEGLCKYVEYKPFSFYRFLAGDTDREVYKIDCSACSDIYLDDGTTDGLYTAGEEIAGGVYSESDNFCGKTFSGLDSARDGTNTNITIFDFYNPLITGDTSKLCMFDHSQRSFDNGITGPNCDEGMVTTYTISLQPDAGGDCQIDQVLGTSTGAINVLTDSTNIFPSASMAAAVTSITETKCGGDRYNCLAGPATDLEEFTENKKLSTIQAISDPVNESEDEQIINTDLSLNYLISAPSSKSYISNMYAANFSRACGDPDVNYGVFRPGDFGTSMNNSPHVNLHQLEGTYENILVGTSDASLNDYLTNGILNPLYIKFEYDYDAAGNIFYNERPSITNSTDLNVSGRTGTTTTTLASFDRAGIEAFNLTLGIYDDEEDYRHEAIAYGLHPFLGRQKDDGTPLTFPFYSFYCLDEQKEKIAQIRLLIREWDSEFSSTSTVIRSKSDVGPSAKMDTTYVDSTSGKVVDIPVITGMSIPKNLIDDWDDFMIRPYRTQLNLPLSASLDKDSSFTEFDWRETTSLEDRTYNKFISTSTTQPSCYLPSAPGYYENFPEDSL